MARENFYREYKFDAAKFADLENELKQAKEEQARLLK
jgi:hypothetical protein